MSGGILDFEFRISNFKWGRDCSRKGREGRKGVQGIYFYFGTDPAFAGHAHAWIAHAKSAKRRQEYGAKTRDAKVYRGGNF